MELHWVIILNSVKVIYNTYIQYINNRRDCSPKQAWLFESGFGIGDVIYNSFYVQALFSYYRRPYNQGSRLTTYELAAYDVPHLLLADSMAAYAMKTYKIDAILVGRFYYLN